MTRSASTITDAAGIRQYWWLWYPVLMDGGVDVRGRSEF